MKILAIYREEEKDIADRMKFFLEKEKISVELFDLNIQGAEGVSRIAGFFPRSGIKEKDENSLDVPSHVLIVSSLPRQWFDFLAGFAYGSSVPFLVCGETAIADIPKQVVFSFIPFLTEDSLQKHLQNEYEAFKRQEEAKGIIKAQETLLRMGIPLTMESLAHCAAEGGIQEISLFLAAGFSPDTRNMAGVPLLNIAARKGNREVFHTLIMDGAQLNLTAEDRGTTALIDSVMCKNCDMVAELIHARADLNVKSKDGQTALVIAVGAGSAEIVEALLKAGADPDISDSMGVSARKYAALFKKDSITSLFAAYAPQKEV